MAGVFFNRYDGYLRVDFRNSPRRGDIEISFYVYGDTTATADCDDQFQVIQQEVTVAPDAILSCWTSSSSSYFFRSMRNWLEAVTRDVHECAFSWEGEGPDGELRWYGGVRESGMLKMSWTGGRDSPSFQHDVRLNKVQMVQALYQSFRDFVESERYDPINYERLTYGEIYDLIVTEGRQAFAHELAQRERTDAHLLMETVQAFVEDRQKGPRRQSSIEDFKRMTRAHKIELPVGDDLVAGHFTSLLDESWNAWSIKQRREYAETRICDLDWHNAFGENLRGLRSSLIEAWLMEQLPLAGLLAGANIWSRAGDRPP